MYCSKLKYFHNCDSWWHNLWGGCCHALWRDWIQTFYVYYYWSIIDWFLNVEYNFNLHYIHPNSYSKYSTSTTCESPECKGNSRRGWRHQRFCDICSWKTLGCQRSAFREIVLESFLLLLVWTFCSCECGFWSLLSKLASLLSCSKGRLRLCL